MTVQFPISIAPRMIGSLQPLSPGEVVRSGLTGAGQQRTSARQRWAATFEFPPLTQAQQALAAVALTQAMKDTLAVTLSQEAIGGPGPIVGVQVNTAWSALFGLSLKGLPSDLALTAGTFLSIMTGGTSYLYRMAADSPAGATTRTIQLTSVPHVVHAINDAVTFLPVLEGAVSWGGQTIDVERLHSLSFTVEQL